MADFPTKERKMAQEAFAKVSERHDKLNESDFREYKSFALSFPTLVHSCGLVQAVAFAYAKKKDKYIDDLEAVFKAVDSKGDLKTRSREAGIMEYMRISRHALSAASWIKRYCQTFGGSD